MPGQVYNYNMS